MCGSPEPREGSAPAEVVPGEQRNVGGDGSARKARVPDDQSRHDGAHVAPSELLSQAPANSHFHVEPAKRLLKIAEGRLDLEHDEDAPDRMVREDVHPTAVAVVGEADLDTHEPAHRHQRRRNLGLEGSMRGIDEPVELFAMPP